MIYNVRNPPGKGGGGTGDGGDGCSWHHLGEPLQPSAKEIIRITSSSDQAQRQSLAHILVIQSTYNHV